MSAPGQASAAADPGAPAPLSCHGLGVAVAGRNLVAELALVLRRGDFVAVLGRNGTGKSLTLHTLAGLRPAQAGAVRLDGQPLAKLPRRRVARRLSLLPQDTEDPFPATVMETVLIGRHPHIGAFSWESPHDRTLAAAALEAVDLTGFADRDVATLSGGERRRAAIAQILAQEPAIYLLDEPTNHLDPQHQLAILDLFARKAAAGAAVLVSLHDVNLAVRYASRCLLLFGDGRWQLGPTRSVLDEETLAALYRTPMEAVRWHDRNLFVARGGTEDRPGSFGGRF